MSNNNTYNTKPSFSVILILIASLVISSNPLHAEVPSETFPVFAVVSNNAQEELEKRLDKNKIKEIKKGIAQASEKIPDMTEIYTTLKDPILLDAFQAYKSAHNKLASILYQYINILISSRLVMHDQGKTNPTPQDILEDALLYLEKQEPELKQRLAILKEKKRLLNNKKLFTGIFERNKNEKRARKNMLIRYMQFLINNIDTLETNTKELRKNMK